MKPEQREKVKLKIVNFPERLVCECKADLGFSIEKNGDVVCSDCGHVKGNITPKKE